MVDDQPDLGPEKNNLMSDQELVVWTEIGCDKLKKINAVSHLLIFTFLSFRAKI